MKVSHEWLAGFFDGEGSVGIWSQGVDQVPTLCVQITQCNEDIIRAIHHNFPDGYIRFFEPKKAWSYMAKGFACRPILLAMYPHLILKQSQVVVALDFLDKMEQMHSTRNRHSNLSSEERDMVFGYKDKIKELKFA